MQERPGPTVAAGLAEGVRQFLDVAGSGIPTAGALHEVAQSLDATSRVVYVDHDPVAPGLVAPHGWCPDEETEPDDPLLHSGFAGVARVPG